MCQYSHALSSMQYVKQEMADANINVQCYVIAVYTAWASGLSMKWSPMFHCSQDFSLRQFLLTNLVWDGHGHYSHRFPRGDSRGESGLLRWKVNLDAIGSSILTLKGFPEFETACTYDWPALFIGGGNSNYITWVKSLGKNWCQCYIHIEIFGPRLQPIT